MKKELRYRPNVAAVILSSRYPQASEILVANRIDIKEDAWQFPQGGIDEGEDPKDALFRELKEEIGTDEVDIIAEYPEWISYEFLNKNAKKMYPYDGQRQKYFLVKLKPTAQISLNTKIPEFTEYKFLSYEQTLEQISFVKKPIYKKVLSYFKKEGYL